MFLFYSIRLPRLDGHEKKERLDLTVLRVSDEIMLLLVLHRLLRPLDSFVRATAHLGTPRDQAC